MKKKNKAVKATGLHSCTVNFCSEKFLHFYPRLAGLCVYMEVSKRVLGTVSLALATGVRQPHISILHIPFEQAIEIIATVTDAKTNKDAAARFEEFKSSILKAAKAA